MALLSSMGIFGLIFLGGGAANVKEVLTNILGPFSTLAGILLAFLIFGMIWFGFKDSDKDSGWNRALWCSGLVMIFIGSLLSRPALFSLGWLITLIFLMIFLFKGGPMDSSGGSGGSGSGGDSDKKGKDGTLKGVVYDNGGNPVLTGVSLKAVDASGSIISGGSATSLADGSFTITLKDLTKKQKVSDITGSAGGNNYSAIQGANTWGGRAPSFTVKPGKGVDGIIVAEMPGGGGGGVGRWTLTPACQVIRAGGAPGPNFGVDNAGNIVDIAGNPVVLNAGDQLNFVVNVIPGFAFNPASTTSYVRLIDLGGNIAQLVNLNPLGAFLNATQTVATFNMPLNVGLISGNYRIRLRLDTL